MKKILLVLCLGLFLVACTPQPTTENNLLQSCTHKTPNIVSNGLGNDTELLQQSIIENFGLTPEQYTLTCLDADFTRGGYIKAQGIYNNSTFTLSYDPGFCSSGGSDCGWSISLQSDQEELLNKVRLLTCQKIFDVHYQDAVNCEGTIFDATNDTRTACINGLFESEENGKKTFSVIQQSNRCDSFAIRG